MAIDLMTVKEISDFLGVTRQRVHDLAKRPDFPEPAATLAVGRIWLVAEVRAWAREWERRLADGDK
jgi:prophage regulatory protein